MIKAVLDTNVFISGLLTPKGNPGKILDYFREKKYTLIATKKILEEVENTLSYPKIAKRIGKKSKQNTVNELKITAKLVNPKKEFHLVADDPDDDKFLEAAEASNADFIVTGDKHLLKLKSYKKTKIITPTEFLKELEKNSS